MTTRKLKKQDVVFFILVFIGTFCFLIILVKLTGSTPGRTGGASPSLKVISWEETFSHVRRLLLYSVISAVIITLFKKNV